MEKLFNELAEEELEAFMAAGELTKLGYRRVSNKYKLVSRIDREDWLDVLATQLRCCRADFYMMDGSGIADNWKEHFCRVYSQDKLTVSPAVYSKMPPRWKI